jgi:hypothetical protein
MRKTSPVLCVCAVLSLAFVAGCGDDEPEEPEGLTTGLRGIYAIDTWTRNEAGCDAEGASILDTQSSKKLAIKIGSTFGAELLVAVPCSDADSCAQNADAGVFAAFAGGALFEEGSDAAGWDTDGSTHSPLEGTCDGSYFTQRLEGAGDKRVKLSTRSIATTFPATGMGMDADCTLESARMSAAGKPCEELEVLTATYEGELADPPK